MTEELASQEQQPKRDCSCSDGTKDAQAIDRTELDSFPDTLYRQSNSGIQSLKMESCSKLDSSGQIDLQTTRRDEYPIENDPHSGSSEQQGRCSQQISVERRLYDKTGNTSANNGITSVLPSTCCLRDMNYIRNNNISQESRFQDPTQEMSSISIQSLQLP
ncbi:MAG: hypothetical protein EZS28_050701, partial [Streblomastix strix]